MLHVSKYSQKKTGSPESKMHIGRSSQILKSKQYNPLICDIKEGHKASTQTKFH